MYAVDITIITIVAVSLLSKHKQCLSIHMHGRRCDVTDFFQGYEMARSA